MCPGLVRSTLGHSSYRSDIMLCTRHLSEGNHSAKHSRDAKYVLPCPPCFHDLQRFTSEEFGVHLDHMQEDLQTIILQSTLLLIRISIVCVKEPYDLCSRDHIDHILEVCQISQCGHWNHSGQIWPVFPCRLIDLSKGGDTGCIIDLSE
jgi:hypothetical protein